MRFAELISMSDSALFISAAPGILTGRDEERLMQMFRRASQHTSGLAPVDWMDRMIPEQYICDGEVRRYEWYE
jgi:hypothetical protein